MIRSLNQVQIIQIATLNQIHVYDFLNIEF